jgi:hypothetical protein
MCAYKMLWTPDDESWRPDHLGAIFDMHKEGMGGIRAAIRCWQLRSETQILDDPNVRKMAYALAVNLKQPVVAWYGNVMNISAHLLPQFEELRVFVDGVKPKVPVYLLTPDVISDPQDFGRQRELPSDFGLADLLSQFGTDVFMKHMGSELAMRKSRR